MSQDSIFISYRREDTAGHVGRLCDTLTAHFSPEQVFMDVDHIEPGVDFVKAIGDAVGSCSVLLAVIGKDWLSYTDGETRRLDNPQDFVRLEITAALNRNILVIPVLVHGATIPRAQDLPADMTGLVRRQAQELGDGYRWKQDVNRLIRTIEKVFSAQQRSGAAAQRRTGESQSVHSGPRRRVILAAIGLFVVLIAGTLAYKSIQRLIPNDRSSSENRAQDTNMRQSGDFPDAGNKPIPAGMVFVSGGTFMMGRNASDGGDEYERPAHRVTVKPYYIDAYEVTREDYQKFVQATNQQPPRDWFDAHYPTGTGKQPVTGVTWDDANAYAEWAGKRLPTEEEWEFASRGTDGRLYPWGNEWRAGMANAGGESAGMADFDKYQTASPFGAYNMIGNAWEWTASELKAYPGGRLPEQPAKGTKVARGGNFKSNHDQATTTYRLGLLAVNDKSQYLTTGFRCIKD